MGQSKTEGPNFSFSLRPRLLLLLGLIINISAVFKLSFSKVKHVSLFLATRWFFFPFNFLFFLYGFSLSSLRKIKRSQILFFNFFPLIQIFVIKNGSPIFTIHIANHLDPVHKCTAIQKVWSRSPNTGVSTFMVYMSWSHILSSHHDMHFIKVYRRIYPHTDNNHIVYSKRFKIWRVLNHTTFPKIYHLSISHLKPRMLYKSIPATWLSINQQQRFH